MPSDDGIRTMKFMLNAEQNSELEIDEALNPYTNSLSLRFDWLNSIIALTIVFTSTITLILGASGTFALGALPVWIQGLWSTVTLATIVWAFGPEVLQAVRGERQTTVVQTVYDGDQKPVETIKSVMATTTKDIPDESLPVTPNAPARDVPIIDIQKTTSGTNQEPSINS